MERLRRFVLIGCLAAFGACEASPRAPSLIATTDSAGIEIVVSPDVTVPGVQIDTVPDLSLGGPEASGAEAFGRVENVVVGPDDSIWVSDLQTADVKVFNPDGSHRVTVGRRGDGPGEFRFVRLLGAAGDSVAVHDRGTGRLTWFSLDGQLLSSTGVATRDGASPLVYDVVEGNRLLGVASENLSVDDLEVGSTFGGTVRFAIWSAPDEPPVAFTAEPTAVFIWHGGGATTAIPFTATAQASSSGRGIDVAAGVNFEIRRFSAAGELEQIARIARDPVPVDGSARADFREFVENAWRGRQRDDALDALDHPGVPESTPAYRYLVSGRDGSSWAYRFAAIPGGQPWDIFRPDGSFAGSVTVPRAFRVTDLTKDFVFGYWTDELGVHYVRRYRIIDA